VSAFHTPGKKREKNQRLQITTPGHLVLQYYRSFWTRAEDKQQGRGRGVTPTGVLLRAPQARSWAAGRTRECRVCARGKGRSVAELVPGVLTLLSAPTVRARARPLSSSLLSSRQRSQLEASRRPHERHG